MVEFRNHCYWLSGMIITIYFSLLIHTLASPPLHFCRHDQRDALLEFKHEIDEHEMDGLLLEHEVQMGVSPDEVVPIDEVVMDESGRKDVFLDDKSPWNKSSDCCHWEGVTCDDKYGQVISLDLHYTILNSSLKTNSSLFRLGYLRYLDLSSCYIRGEIPSSIGNLSHLTFIDLSFNSLVGKIPSSIGNLSRLTNLDLSANLLVGKIPSSIGYLSHLTLVDLTSNELVGEIPDIIGNLYHLRNLSLAFNHLTGEIPSSIGNLSRLLKLDLFSNNLVGEVPASMGNLNKLRVIRLARNNFSGNIPVLLANLTKLFLFSLSYNNFTSTLPSDMSGFHSLAYFDVSENSFVGPFPKSLFSVPSLNYVDLGGNQFTGPIQFVNTSSTSKLRYLFLSSNRFNGPIPESISEFLNLADLDLSHNNFTGPIPRSLSKLINLWSLRLSNNKLKGEVPGFLWRLATVNLSHNIFSSFGNSPIETQILNLDLSSNSFQGPFPHEICNLDSVFFIDLSNNLFNGSIPPCLRNSIVLLQEIILRNNSFTGVVPDIFAGATKLRSLDVSVNQLEGQFPKSLINCITLKFVNVESNRIKDRFPFWLGFLPFLNVLILKSNEFYGPLYHRHMSVGFKSLKVMDVSHNNFTGTLPPHYFSNWGEPTTSPPEGDGYMINSLNDSSIYRNSMEMVNKGVDTRFERIREDFIAIDFSGNRIYGKIPESIGFLKELRLLNLSGNAFTGDIPQSLANLTNLETLDLSSNKLSGQIPHDLGKLSFLSYMNFSHNCLQGPVPQGTQFQRQNCSSFLDNPGLYGLEDICGKSHVLDPTSQQPEEFSEAEEQMFNWVAAAIAYGPGVFCGLVIGHIFSSHNHKWFTEKFGRRKLRVSAIAR